VNAYPGNRAHGKLPPMRSFVVAMALAFGACGDDGSDAPKTLLQQLEVLPGVHDVQQLTTLSAGYQYFVLHFEQPVDHGDPDGPSFLQKVSLMHRDLSLPMVEYTSGYWDYYNDRLVELTGLLGGNQVSIEHRYFDSSRPDPVDWSKLTIEQMAHDQHAITSALRMVYSGAFITAGASKGGMTAVYYRRFYPDDVDGTVPYVAPISFGAPDPRYVPFLDTVGPADCRQAVRNVAIELLANRRTEMLAKAMAQADARSDHYTRVLLGPAVESAIFNLEWSYWQYYGASYCTEVPATTATNDELFGFLDDISPVSDNTDERIGQFDAYYYQAYQQLGFPDGGAAYLDPYLTYTDADYAGALPTETPVYDGGAAMDDIDQFVQNEGARLVFIYGQWDPWTGGQFTLGNASDSLHLTQAEGTHGARITELAEGDREAVLAKLEEWTGVVPRLPASPRSFAPESPRLPPAIRRAVLFRRR
jgi:hypothetical protein